MGIAVIFRENTETLSAVRVQCCSCIEICIAFLLRIALIVLPWNREIKCVS